MFISKFEFYIDVIYCFYYKLSFSVGYIDGNTKIF